jgi:CrcB protein
MSLLTWLSVGLLGGCGAILRFLLDGAVSSRITTSFPLGTLAVNLAGALALGVLVGAGVGGTDLRVVGIGLLGSFTTFSTWMLESERLSEEGEATTAMMNLLASLALGVCVAWLGMQIGEAL